MSVSFVMCSELLALAVCTISAHRCPLSNSKLLSSSSAHEDQRPESPEVEVAFRLHAWPRLMALKALIAEARSGKGFWPLPIRPPATKTASKRIRKACRRHGDTEHVSPIPATAPKLDPKARRLLTALRLGGSLSQTEDRHAKIPSKMTLRHTFWEDMRRTLRSFRSKLRLIRFTKDPGTQIVEPEIQGGSTDPPGGKSFMLDCDGGACATANGSILDMLLIKYLGISFSRPPSQALQEFRGCPQANAHHHLPRSLKIESPAWNRPADASGRAVSFTSGALGSFGAWQEPWHEGRAESTGRRRHAQQSRIHEAPEDVDDLKSQAAPSILSTRAQRGQAAAKKTKYLPKR